MVLTVKRIDLETRTYSNESGEVVAIASSPDGFDRFIDYFCLCGVWEAQNDTTIVTEAELDLMLAA
jgi:hypothetical protein